MHPSIHVIIDNWYNETFTVFLFQLCVCRQCGHSTMHWVVFGYAEGLTCSLYVKKILQPTLNQLIKPFQNSLSIYSENKKRWQWRFYTKFNEHVEDVTQRIGKHVIFQHIQKHENPKLFVMRVSLNIYILLVFKAILLSWADLMQQQKKN